MSMSPGTKARRYARALVTRTLEFEFERMPYRLENVSARKLWHLMRSTANCSLAHPREPMYPIQLQIEPSAACTLHCPTCPSGTNNMGRRREIMSPSTLEAIIDDTCDHAVIAVLWMWGEPFTNPQLPEMTSYAHNKGLATVTSTNGQHIQTRDEAERLVASGLDNLIVATDGATQETYSKFRVGGDVHRIFRCLELIRQAKDALGSDKPGVNVRCVVTKNNEHEQDEIERMARKFGADMVSAKTIFALDYRDDGADVGFTPGMRKNRSFMRGGSERPWSPDMDWRCRRPWNRLTVTADGTVLPCEFDYSQTEAFGKGGVGQSFIDVWRNAAAQDFRRRHLANKKDFPFCRACCCGWIRTGRETTVSMKHLARTAADCPVEV